MGLIEILGVLYLAAFWGSLVFVYHDAKRREQRVPLIQVLGVAVTAPVGILLYLSMRE